MRTTLTLDPDVAKLVRETVERERISLKDVINDALRRGLQPNEPRQAFRVVPDSSPLQPGIDPRGFNQLAEELEDEAVLSARPLLGFKTKTDTVVLSLQELIRRKRIGELKGLMGNVRLEIDVSRSRRRPRS